MFLSSSPHPSLPLILKRNEISCVSSLFTDQQQRSLVSGYKSLMSIGPKQSSYSITCAPDKVASAFPMDSRSFQMDSKVDQCNVTKSKDYQRSPLPLHLPPIHTHMHHTSTSSVLLTKRPWTVTTMDSSELGRSHYKHLNTKIEVDLSFNQPLIKLIKCY